MNTNASSTQCPAITSSQLALNYCCTARQRAVVIMAAALSFARCSFPSWQQSICSSLAASLQATSRSTSSSQPTSPPTNPLVRCYPACDLAPGRLSCHLWPLCPLQALPGWAAAQQARTGTRRLLPAARPVAPAAAPAPAAPLLLPGPAGSSCRQSLQPGQSRATHQHSWLCECDSRPVKARCLDMHGIWHVLKCRCASKGEECRCQRFLHTQPPTCQASVCSCAAARCEAEHVQGHASAARLLLHAWTCHAAAAAASKRQQARRQLLTHDAASNQSPPAAGEQRPCKHACVHKRSMWCPGQARPRQAAADVR